MMISRKLMLGVLIVLMTAGCAASRPAQSQATGTTANPVAATPTRARQRPTPTPAEAQAAAASPTVAPTTSVAPTAAPSATPTPQPTATSVPSSTTVAPANQSANLQTAPVTTGGTSGLLLSLNANKYPAPTLITPANNVVYHVAQPVVHFSWSPTPTDLMTFGQTLGCVSDATNFRRAFESYQLVIHSLDGSRPDQVQWTDNNPSYDLNLTTIPAGRYSWSASVVTLCESYVVGKRNNTYPNVGRHDDPAYHASTLQRTYVAPASPTSAVRTFNWVP